MRVLHLIPSISPRRGGPSQAVLAMTSALRHQGVEASILTTNDDGPDHLSGFPLGRWHEHAGVPVLAFARWSPPLRVLREFAVSPALVSWLRSHLADYDLLHVHALFSFPSTVGMALARRRGVPYIVRTIGQLQHWSLRQSSCRKRLLLGLIERRNLQGASALHFTSDAERREAASLTLSTPSFVLPLGVELPQVFGQLVSERLDAPVRFLFLSRLHPKKQLPLLLQALALMRRRRPHAQWHLDIAGDGEPAYVAELRRQADQLGLTEQLQWHGFVAGQAKAELLQKADWFVLPSAAENFGIAAIEALASGTPVILTPEVGIASQIGAAGAGRLVEGNVEALAECLMKSLMGPSVTMRQAARRLAETSFCWDAIAIELKTAYANSLNAVVEESPACRSF
ncbi:MULTISPECIES: glycosyltransferase [unclassified Synechococcus]|uniref:glycosyltransferase n=1 Tax=unclassified Synechococcus TaxID=2626047 RepID=UPI0008FF2E0C|nr:MULTISPECIES: glycosyltransferase [unclassified Synechococcus]APD48719.1 hypothetical protein BM449_11325 [Synechococcus sp. SynAce01]TWB95304.1 glycosyltransferase involved in cell wall biosynthesis [Synechococcus sp. Ace-Pa]